MKLANKSGDRLYRKVTISVFSPDNKAVKRNRLYAGIKRGYTAENIETILRNAAEQVEKRFPQHEYSLVPVGPTEFNFVSLGRKRVAA